VTDAPNLDSFGRLNAGRGRPLGSRDRYPRQRSTVVRGGQDERARMLEAENGQLRYQLAKRDERIAELEQLFASVAAPARARHADDLCDALPRDQGDLSHWLR
jgi:hypothetical protein